MAKKEILLILDNIRSAENVGSIFRTADAAGIDKIFLVGISPAPIDRFNRPVGKIAKSALGAEKTMCWEKRDDIKALIKELQDSKVKVIAVEQTKQAKDYKGLVPDSSAVFIFGNEVEGISGDVLSLCDEVVEIPMEGNKESLNVSVAVGVLLYRVLNI